MSRRALCILAFLASQALTTQHSHAADAVKPPFDDDELSKQDRIYRSRGEQRPDGYVIDRSLLSYAYTLSAEFDRSLAALGPNDRWLDIGAGRGQAVLDYVAGRYDAMNADKGTGQEAKAQAVAMSIEDRRTPVWEEAAARLGPERIRYLSGRRLSEYPLKELGQFQLISDVIGGFSYTTTLSMFIERVLSLLEVNGNFYTVLQDVHAEDGSNKPYYEGSGFLTEIARDDGSELKVCPWLKSITCVEVTCELKSKWQPPIEVYRIHKTCSDVKVPALSTIFYQAGTPPERRFRLVD